MSTSKRGQRTVLKSSKRCGEIILNFKGVIEIHCSLCLSSYESYDYFLIHLNEHISVPTNHPSKNFNDRSPKILRQPKDKEYKDEKEHPLNCLQPELFVCKRKSLEVKNTSKDLPNISNNQGISSKTDVKTDENIPKQSKTESQASKVGDINQDVLLETNIRPVRKKTNYLRRTDEDRKYTCTLCPAAFKDKYVLQKHIFRHSTGKSHQCPLCPKMFYTPIDVKKHLRSHTNERPFLCTTCGRTFVTNVKLKEHMYRHTNERNYKCTECEKSFYDANLLANHKLVHTRERPHKCTICEAKFARGYALRNHMRLHENKREYQCQLCKSAFNQQAGLFCHMKNKHNCA